jgi:hypothetical protein
LKSEVKMKILAILMTASVLLFSYAFADSGEEAAAEKVVTGVILRQEEPDYVKGKIACVLPSSLKRPKAELTVIDQNGGEFVFPVKALAVVYDSYGEILPLGRLEPGTGVEVHYRKLPNGVIEATSVRVSR